MEPFLWKKMTTHNCFVNNQGQIHGKHPSYEGSHMDNKVHEIIRVHEKKEGDSASMWQPRHNIINKESHPTCSNKTHWCSTSLCSKISWKWQNHVWILFNKGHGGGCAYQDIVKKMT